MTSIRELAERTSNGALTRLFWLQGTRQLWVEVYDPELDETIVIPAEPGAPSKRFTTPTRLRAPNMVPRRRRSTGSPRRPPRIAALPRSPV